MPVPITRLAEASDIVLLCREMGHAWQQTTDANVVTRGPGGRIIEFTRHAACLRCMALRKQVIEVPSFRVRTASITYPDGYLLSGSHVRKWEVRREVLDRLTQTGEAR